MAEDRFEITRRIERPSAAETVLAMTRPHPSPPKPRRFTEKDLQLVLLHGALALGARLLPTRLWGALCRLTAAPKAGRLRRKGMAAFRPRATAVLGPLGDRDAARLFDRQRQRLFERHLTYLREHIRPDPVQFEFDGLDRLFASLAGGRGAILWVTPGLADTIVTKRALAQAGVRAFQVSVRSHGFSQSRFAVRHINPGQLAAEDRHLGGRILFDGDDTHTVTRQILTHLGAGQAVLFANSRFAGRSFLAVPFAPGFLLPLASTPLSIAARKGVPIHIVTGVETDSFRSYRIAISADLRIGLDPAEDAQAAMALRARDHLRAALRDAPDQIRLFDSLIPEP